MGRIADDEHIVNRLEDDEHIGARLASLADDEQIGAGQSYKCHDKLHWTITF